MMLSKSRSDLRKFPSTLSAFIQFAIFFIWAIVVGVITILILFSTVSVFCIPSSSVLRAFGSPAALALQVNSEIVVKRMRIVRILYSHGMYYIIQQILLHFLQACHGLVRPVNAKLLVLPVTFYLSEIDNSLTCFCFYCSFY